MGQIRDVNPTEGADEVPDDEYEVADKNSFPVESNTDHEDQDVFDE